jgi:hypothetical protein
LATTPLTGIKIIITANPARTDGPTNIQHTQSMTLAKFDAIEFMYKIISLQDFSGYNVTKKQTNSVALVCQ